MTAKTVTMDHIKSLVTGCEFIRPQNAPTLTICVIQLANGFTVRGESACADPAAFDEAMGRDLAYRDAIQKVWPLEGYLLRQRLHEQQASKDFYEPDFQDLAAEPQNADVAGWTIIAEGQSIGNTICDGTIPEDPAEWRRARAIELAISAGGMDAAYGVRRLIEAAREIETFLKG